MPRQRARPPLAGQAFLDRGHPPQQREPAFGYASRLAALNGRHLERLCADMCIGVYDLGRGEPDEIASLAALRNLGPAEVEALIRHSPRRKLDERVATVAGHGLPRDGFTSTTARFCPHCVAEDLASFEGPRAARPWMRLEWTIRHVRVCRRHGNLLVPMGGRDWQVFDFSRHVAAMLPELDRLRDETAEGPGTAYCDWLAGRIYGTLDPGSWLDDVPLHAAIVFCEALGFSALHGDEIAPTSLSMEGWASAAEEGYRTASQGAEAIVALFDRMAAERPSVGGMLAHEKAYGHLFRTLRMNCRDPAFEKPCAILRDHVFSTMSFRPGRKFLGVAIEARRVHTLRTAARSSSKAVPGMKRLVSRSPLAGTGDKVLSKPGVTFAVEEVDALAASLADHLTLKDVSKRTGFHPRIIDHLVERGYLRDLPKDARPAGSYYRFRLCDVDALMARLFRDAVPAVPTDRRMTVTKVHFHVRGMIVDLLTPVLEGRLGWVGRLEGGDRYEHLMIDMDEVLALRRPVSDRTDLYGPEAEKLIRGVRADAMNKLAGLGYLTWSRHYCPMRARSFRTFTRESVKAFAAEYVTRSELRSATGIGPRGISSRLKAAGIFPILERSEVEPPIYKRREVEAARLFEGWPPAET